MPKKSKITPASPPAACNAFWVNHLAMLLVYLAIFSASALDPGLITYNILFIPLLYAIPITVYEVLILRVHQRESVGLGKKRHPFDASRLLIKLFGFAMILATLAFFYWLLPIYRDAGFQTFFSLARAGLPHWCVLAVGYFLWMDLRQAEPKDDYWHMGMFFLGRWKQTDFNAVQELARSWLVKGFFLPLMAQFLYNELGGFMNTSIIDWSMPRQLLQNGEWLTTAQNIFTQLSNTSFYIVYEQLIRLVFIADLIPACIGYALTLKLLDTHIRSADNSFKGWFFCLICYPPFWSTLIFPQYLPYMDGYNWSKWLMDSPLRWAWGAAIFISLTIYSSASVCFGTRWSNLTYRGLMCTGPYRICKHPAYLFKNLAWWLIGVPFIVEGDWEASLRQVLFAVGVSYIYYQRAITEEKHLSRYLEYRNYALWMNDHAYLRILGRIFPFLKYNPAKYGY